MAAGALLLKRRFSLLHLLLVGTMCFVLGSMIRRNEPVMHNHTPALSPALKSLRAQQQSPASAEGLGAAWLPEDHPKCQAPLPPETSDYELHLQPMAALGNMKLHPEANEWGVPYAASTIEVNGKTLTVDDIVTAYDWLFENLALFSHSSWFNVAVQQDPSDAFGLQQLLYSDRPDILVEIGTNTGGGAVFYASIMREYSNDARVITLDPKDPSEDWAAAVGQGCPTCVDARCSSPWREGRIQFIRGFAHEQVPAVQAEILKWKTRVGREPRVLIMHDGSHYYDDVLRDLNAYDPLCTLGSYMIVQDTKMTRMYTPLNGNGYPLKAAETFVANQGHGRYQVDRRFEFGLYSQHHKGFLKKILP